MRFLFKATFFTVNINILNIDAYMAKKMQGGAKVLPGNHAYESTVAYKKLSYRRGTARCVVSIFQKPRWRRQLSWKTTKIAISQQRIGRSSRNLAWLCKMGLLTAQTVKNWISKIQDGGRPPIWKPLNRNIAATVWPILMKFGTVTQIGPRQGTHR